MELTFEGHFVSCAEDKWAKAADWGGSPCDKPGTRCWWLGWEHELWSRGSGCI